MRTMLVSACRNAVRSTRYNLLPRYGGTIGIETVSGSSQLRYLSISTGRTNTNVITNTNTSNNNVVDLRSDTVTSPSPEMLQCVLNARTGDDVMGEDPTVLELEETMATLFGKQAGLFVPTGTMANLCAILSHCHGRASEILIGQNSHILLWEGGNAANLGGVHTRQLRENPDDATLDEQDVRDAFRLDNDDHFAKTEALCLENTHNMLGGIALPPEYIDRMGKLTKELDIRLHIDGARIFNSIVSHGVSPADMCRGADSVSICLSKGLGAPLGSVLVGDAEFIRLAKRARKRCGGGMRQAGVVAAMGLFAVQNNVERLAEDHRRARRIGEELKRHGFRVIRDGRVDTNIVYFGIPHESTISKDEMVTKLNAGYNIKLTGGYSRGGELFRICTHLDLNEEDVDRSIEALVNVCCQL